MAHGFAREPGSGRGYRNVSNPDFITGLRLSRRQYDAYVERIGARNKRASVGELREALIDTRNAMRDARARMRLAEREIEATASQAAYQQELEQAEAAFARSEKMLHARARTDAGGRWYVTYRKAWVEARRAEGERITLRQADADPRFREAWTLAKGRPNPRGDLAIARANKAGRERAYRQIEGASEDFKQLYDKRYGQRPVIVRRSGAAGSRRRA